MSRSVADALRAAKALIDTPEKWSCRDGAWYRPEETGKRCVVIALTDADSFNAIPLFKRANGFVADVAKWNDAPERTHADVMQAFDRAIALAEQEASL